MGHDLSSVIDRERLGCGETVVVHVDADVNGRVEGDGGGSYGDDDRWWRRALYFVYGDSLVEIVDVVGDDW